MKLIIIPLFLIIFYSFCFAQESLERFQESLLESNFDETPYTALVKVTDVQRKGHEMLYPTYMFVCEVIETFKGKHSKNIQYMRGVEDEYKELPVGKSYIVSLFISKKNKMYYISDNGYDLPASNQLIKIARQLAKNLKDKE